MCKYSDLCKPTITFIHSSFCAIYQVRIIFYAGVENPKNMWYNKICTVSTRSHRKERAAMSADIEKTIFCYGKPFFPQGTFVPDRKHTCCFTGHRPDKMPTGDKLGELRLRVRTAAEFLLNRGYDTFITGMAPGFDLFAAEILLHESEFRQVKLICALPYRCGTERGLPRSTRKMQDCRLLLRELRQQVL